MNKKRKRVIFLLVIILLIGLIGQIMVKTTKTKEVEISEKNAISDSSQSSLNKKG